MFQILIPFLRSAHRARPLLITAVAVFGLPCVAATAIEPGDVLRIEVLSAPEVSREAAVDADGRIAVPLLGTVAVAGRDTETIAAEIAAAFEERALLKSPVVLVEVAAYRPVYVGGTVARPGAYDFVPGMTARKAVIAAGGVRLPLTENAATAEDLLAVVAERRAKGFLLAQTEARIARLEAELAGDAALDAHDEAPGWISPTVLESTWAAESHLLTENREHIVARTDYAQELLELVTLEIGILDHRAELQESEIAMQQAEIDRANGLLDRGVIPRTRMQELLRERSQLNRDVLETSAFAARARQEATKVRFDLVDETARYRETVRLELQNALADRVELEAQIEALGLRLLAAGLVTPDIATTRLVIFRDVDGTAARIEAGLDDPVQPGDVLELSLEQSPPSAARPEASESDPASYTEAVRP